MSHVTKHYTLSFAILRTEEADRDAISSHVSNTILSGLVGELPEGGKVHLYYFCFELLYN